MCSWKFRLLQPAIGSSVRVAAKAGSDLDQFGELVDAFLFKGAGEDSVEAHQKSIEEFVSEFEFEFAQWALRE